MNYRLLERDDTIEKMDEWLDDNCVDWHSVTNFRITSAMVGLSYKPNNFVPFRRPVPPNNKMINHFKYERSICPNGGASIADNWYVRHLKAECSVAV